MSAGRYDHTYGVGDRKVYRDISLSFLLIFIADFCVKMCFPAKNLKLFICNDSVTCDLNKKVKKVSNYIFFFIFPEINRKFTLLRYISLL